jgi:hypothetical protein
MDSKYHPKMKAILNLINKRQRYKLTTLIANHHLRLSPQTKISKHWKTAKTMIKKVMISSVEIKLKKCEIKRLSDQYHPSSASSTFLIKKANK